MYKQKTTIKQAKMHLLKFNMKRNFVKFDFPVAYVQCAHCSVLTDSTPKTHKKKY